LFEESSPPYVGSVGRSAQEDSPEVGDEALHCGLEVSEIAPDVLPSRVAVAIADLSSDDGHERIGTIAAENVGRLSLFSFVVRVFGLWRSVQPLDYVSQLAAPFTEAHIVRPEEPKPWQIASTDHDSQEPVDIGITIHRQPVEAQICLLR